ncbi:MAG: dihydrofolate reductase family protein [Thermoplasmata archaeon]|nr:dihydrofolate reductase family protein [Thermoplasmata archaeon]
MREVVLQMHITLDGAADTKDGFVPIMDRPYWKELAAALKETAASKVDTLLLGKGTYQQFAGFWPKTAADPASPADWREQARGLDETPKVVFSKSLSRADWRGSTIVRGDLGTEIARLKRRPGKNMLVPGGVAFPRALIEQDLVDEYLLSVVPVISGPRRYPLFGPLARPRTLRHLRCWTFRNGVVLHQYRRGRKSTR